MAREITVSNATAGAVVPEDVYKAEVTGLQEKTLMWEGQETENLEFTFKILDEDYEGTEVRGLARYPEYLTPKCKLRLWAQAIMGREFGENETIDLDALIGKQCRISTINKPGKKGGEFTNIKDILPARARQNGQAQTKSANY
jgi:hypothetical protein